MNYFIVAFLFSAGVGENTEHQTADAYASHVSLHKSSSSSSDDCCHLSERETKNAEGNINEDIDMEDMLLMCFSYIMLIQFFFQSESF